MHFSLQCAGRGFWLRRGGGRIGRRDCSLIEGALLTAPFLVVLGRIAKC